MDQATGRNDEAVARHAVQVKAHDPGDVLAEILAARLARLAGAAEEAGIDDDGLAFAEPRHRAAELLDRCRAFDADDERKRALGERHAAQAKEVDVVERDGAHAHQHLVRSRCRRIIDCAKFELFFLDEPECAHVFFG